MSLEIDTNKITWLLLQDGWHKVEDAEDGRSSLDVDAYEFVEGSGEEPRTVLGGGSVPGVCSTGAAWMELHGGRPTRIVCPMTSILAVRTK